ncbi:WD domain protein [Puccinia graminis f. sp. tritici]|uniref:WD domain protein n=1 Tax=Puccinia graminis f. sp. tritici TaxID=56615 RepID=A0A5B0QRS7_PUCGR|nr:WD domain protein [Puccinia graminis f. sp. tritici]
MSEADPPNNVLLENNATTTDGVLQGSNHEEESNREEQDTNQLTKESPQNEPEDAEKEAEEERKLRGNQEAYARVTHTLKGHSRPISSLSFSPDGTKLSSSSADGVILIWNVILPEKPSSDRGGVVGHQVEFMSKLVDGASEDEENDRPREGINDLAWSPDSEYLVSGSDDHAIHVWAPSSQSLPSNPSSSSSSSTTRPIRKLLGHSHCVYCVKFNPIGTLLISGSFDETVKVWDFLAGKLLRTLPGHSEVVSCLDFSRDGSVIVSGSFDGLIRMWDTTSGQCLKTMVVAQETNAPVYSIPARVISRVTTTNKLDPGNPIGDRDLVLMGSEDGSLWIWDLQSRELVLRKASHQDSIIGISVHPTNPSIFATAGLDKDPSIKLVSLSCPPSLKT